jgi:hypothetical protein
VVRIVGAEKCFFLYVLFGPRSIHTDNFFRDSQIGLCVSALDADIYVYRYIRHDDVLYSDVSTKVLAGGSAAGRAILLPPKLHDTAYGELGGVQVLRYRSGSAVSVTRGLCDVPFSSSSSNERI